MNLIISGSAILLFIFIKPSENCNGYKMILNHVRNCRGNNIIKPLNISSKLDENCIITTSGCISSRGFKTAKITYSLSKPPLPVFRGNADFCADPNKNSQELSILLTSVNIPRTCPQKAGTTCFNKSKTNVENSKQLIGRLEGTSHIQINFDHGNRKSCIDISLTVKKQ